MSLLTNIKFNPHPTLSPFSLSASVQNRQGGERDSREWEEFLSDSKRENFHTQALSPMDDVGFGAYKAPLGNSQPPAQVFMFDGQSLILSSGVLAVVEVFQFHLFLKPLESSEDRLARFWGLLEMLHQGCLLTAVRIHNFQTILVCINQMCLLILNRDYRRLNLSHTFLRENAI